MEPSILFAPTHEERSQRLDEIRSVIASQAGSPIWNQIKTAAIHERDLAPYLPDSVFPGRSLYDAQRHSIDARLCISIANRIQRHALMFLIDGDRQWIDAALRQTDELFDDGEYPVWNHMARMHDANPEVEARLDQRRHEVHLRTGALARDVGIMLNWLRPYLDQSQLDTLIRGLEKRAIRPYQKALAEKPWWVEVNNNWLTSIVGGMGICGMALDGLHPDAKSLIDFADPRMERHLADYGSEGEFNEGLGYAGAIGLTVNYFAARLGWTRGRENRLAAAPFPAIAHWFMHMTVPPGHLFGYGDCHTRAPLKADWMVALASANQDSVVQGYALHYRSIAANTLHLLCLDSDLAPTSPASRLPLGRAYHEHGATIASRTSWDFENTASVVGSKARREDNHEHNDPGQVVIDGEGQPLIVDRGKAGTAYPAGFFTENRFRYYDTNAFGHNILVFGGREMKSCYELHPNHTSGPLHGKRALHAQGQIVSSEFDDNWGGRWSIDTTAAWDGVKSNLRTVLHIHPGFVIVLDEAQLETTESISLRWNTVKKPTLVGDDGFSLQSEGVGLAARVLNLHEGETTHRIANHQYKSPWNMDQFGTQIEQREAPYFETVIEADHCRLLSLFAVQPGNETIAWTQKGDVHTGTFGDAKIEVAINTDGLTIHSFQHKKIWNILCVKK